MSLSHFIAAVIIGVLSVPGAIYVLNHGWEYLIGRYSLPSLLDLERAASQTPAPGVPPAGQAAPLGGPSPAPVPGRVIRNQQWIGLGCGCEEFIDHVQRRRRRKPCLQHTTGIDLDEELRKLTS